MDEASIRVLIVDDEPAHVEAIKRAVKYSGAVFSFQVVDSLLKYRQVVAENPPDIALIDLNLPDGRAVDVLSSPLESAPFPILIMTSHINEQTALDVLKYGALDYVIKSPSAFAELHRILTRTLREWKLLQERKITDKALLDSLDKYQTLFREMMDGFALHEIICDADGVPSDYRFLAVNPAFERLTGLTADRIVGRTVLQVLPRTELRWIETYGRVALTGEPAFLQEYSAGLNKYFEVKAFRYAHNQFVTIFTDITKAKQAEKERADFENMLQQSQKMESVGRLAGGVAHDFNNMLSVILGHSNLMLEGMASDHPCHNGLDEIRKAAERSAALTRQLLAFARKQTIEPRLLNLNETVAGMLTMLQRLLGEQINLLWQPSEKLWNLNMDPSQIDQILANLCVNARDAIADVGQITIETQNIVIDNGYCEQNVDIVPGEFVRLAISDDGCGMDNELRNHIFEPFFTTKEIGEGTGLGLATVYGIVKQNGGFINVYSEPGIGTTFTIYLPRHAAEIRQEQKDIVKDTEPCGHETILLVEDELSILKINAIILKKQGYKVLSATSPEEAIHLAGEHPGEIHLLMTDVVMPEMNGRALAKKLQSLYPQLKCLFTSGYTANVIAHHGVLDDGVQFIQKPYSISDLTKKIRETLLDV